MGRTAMTSMSHESERRSGRIAVVVVAAGVQAIVTQSLLLREGLVLLFGSEFAWGVVLFAWLLGVAFGAIVGGWLADRQRRCAGTLITVLLALGVAACVDLWVFRGARGWLGVEPGEFMPLTRSAVAALVLISPTSALVGMVLPLVVCIRIDNGRLSQRDSDSPSSDGAPGTGGVHIHLGSAFALESVGSLIGGAAFSFWAVDHLRPIQTALTCAALSIAASVGLLGTSGRSRLRGTGLLAIAGAALATSVFGGRLLDRALVQRRWNDIAPGHDLCAEVDSKYQNLAVGRRAGQFTLYGDGQVLADFPDPYSFVPQAHFWACQHPSPQNVLVLGGGAEGLLAELLLHPMKHVDYVEPDPQALALIVPYLDECDRKALSDPRVSVHNVDVRYFVKTQRSRYDLVIARLGEPTSALRARLFTDEFYRELARAMRPRSVLCMTVFAAPGGLSTRSAEYVASIRATLRRHFAEVVVTWGNPAHILAATEPGLCSVDPVELSARYRQRGVNSKRFDAAWFDGATDWLSPPKLRQRAAELDAVNHPQISSDLHPAIYLQRLALWESATRSRGALRRAPADTAESTAHRGIIDWLRSLRWPEVLLVLLAAAAGTLLISWVGRRAAPAAACDTAVDGAGSAHTVSTSPTAFTSRLARSAIVLSIWATGFATMALSIIWLFAFQNLYGYVYQRIGWIIALFMAGLVIGCELRNIRSGLLRLRRRFLGRPIDMENPESSALSNRRTLIVVDMTLSLLALMAPLALAWLGNLPTTPRTLLLVEACISVMVMLTGVLGGAAFAEAALLQLHVDGRRGFAAGTIVGADHAGACLGALLSGIVLVPVFGTCAAAVLVAGMKLSSAALLILGRRATRKPKHGLLHAGARPST
ncbi:MAG: hypothetical protein ACE5HE_04575 [Phycisphaerae bacterium]